jgi:hypothetical protein
MQYLSTAESSILFRSLLCLGEHHFEHFHCSYLLQYCHSMFLIMTGNLLSLDMRGPMQRWTCFSAIIAEIHLTMVLGAGTELSRTIWYGKMPTIPQIIGEVNKLVISIWCNNIVRGSGNFRWRCECREIGILFQQQCAISERGPGPGNGHKSPP